MSWTILPDYSSDVVDGIGVVTLTFSETISIANVETSTNGVDYVQYYDSWPVPVSSIPVSNLALDTQYLIRITDGSDPARIQEISVQVDSPPPPPPAPSVELSNISPVAYSVSFDYTISNGTFEKVGYVAFTFGDVEVKFVNIHIPDPFDSQNGKIEVYGLTPGTTYSLSLIHI